MSTPPVTAFAETAALYYLINEDLHETRRIIGDMLPGERRVYAESLSVCGRWSGRTASSAGR